MGKERGWREGLLYPPQGRNGMPFLLNEEEGLTKLGSWFRDGEERGSSCEAVIMQSEQPESIRSGDESHLKLSLIVSLSFQRRLLERLLMLLK